MNCIIVKDFPRFTRNEIESGYYTEKVFPLYRIRFISVNDGFDSNDYRDGTGGIEVKDLIFLAEQHCMYDDTGYIKSVIDDKLT